MASIFRKQKSPFWFAAYRDAQGNRTQRTTKCKERRIALRMALEWENAAAAGRNGALTEAACRKVISEIHEHAEGSKLSFYTVQGWIDEWLSNRAGTTAPRTLVRYKATCRDFLTGLGDRGKLSLGALTTTDLRKFRDALRKGGHSAATCNQSLKILSGPLEQARRLGLVAVNPVHGVSPLKDDNVAKRDAFTVAQIQSLLEVTRGTDWEGCIMLGAFCGLRLMDAARITWSAIDLGTRLLSTQTAKRGTGVTVPLHPFLLAWLRTRTRGIGKAPVLPELADKGGSGKSGLSSVFKRIMGRAKISGSIAREGHGAGRTTSTLSFHSTRHFFCSQLAANGVPEDVRKRLAGHADSKSHAVYSAHEMESLFSAIDALPLTGLAK